jgi:hypothetical protein
MDGHEERLMMRWLPGGVSAVGISTRRRPVISWIPGMIALKSHEMD